MSSLEIYTQRLTGGGQRVFAYALNCARRRGQNYVVVEHFIEALITEEGRFFGLLADLLEIDLTQIQARTEGRLQSFPERASGKLRLSPAAVAFLNRAWEVARDDRRPKIDSSDMILALARDDRGALNKLFKGLNANAPAAIATIQTLDRCARILSRTLDDEKTEPPILLKRAGGELTPFPEKNSGDGPHNVERRGERKQELT
jgi:ATP-dependent Clp protease ATP-binding subunit ClpA